MNKVITTSALLAAVSVSTAHAGGFALNERSAKAIGGALSGSVSAASDASFATFNPAALSTVEETEAAFAATLVAPVAEATVDLTGEKVDADQAAVVPGFAFGHRVHPEVVIGLTTYSPFGLTTDYEADFIGAAEAQTSKLTTVSVSPTAAWSITPGLTLGASVNVLYSDARLTNSIVALEGDSMDVGFSFGALLKPTSTTTLGAAFHSGYDLTLKGSNRINVLEGAPSFGLTARASLPEVVMAGVTQEVTDDLRLMAEGRWFNWSVFDTIDLSTPRAPNLTPLGGPDFTRLQEVQNYEDAIFVSVGAEYDLTERLTFRGGVGYDETPTTDEDRTLRVPDADRLWLGIGASYEVTDRLTLDAGYAYLHGLDDPEVELETVPATVSYDSAAHLFALGGAVRF